MTPTSNPVIWQADNTHPELAEAIRQALREVLDPEIGLSVIELGLVRDLSISDSSAQLNMILTTPFCPYASTLLEMARQKSENILERPTTVQVGLEMWDPSMMEEGAGAGWGFF